MRRIRMLVSGFAVFDTFTGAQLVKHARSIGLAVLALDALLFVVLCGLAILPPTAGARPREATQGETIRLLLLVAVAYAVPYFLVFSHPTFHFTDVPLVGLLGAVAGATLLDTGVRPAWASLSRRGRTAVALGLLAFVAIQLEWAVHVLERAQ